MAAISLRLTAGNNGAMQRHQLALSVATWILLSTSVAAASTNVITEPFEGVRVIHSRANEPRLVDMWVVEINPTAPGISFLVTPSNGELPGDTTPLTVRSFVESAGAQLGVNGSFFSLAAKGAAGKGQYNVSGLSVSKGDAYSSFERGFVDAINIARDNVATIIRGKDGGLDHKPATSLYNALSGKNRLVRDGQNVAGNDPAIHPRTAIGIKADGKLLLFTVDGREPGHSLGLTFREMADVLIRFGARDAISLDGGGSTTFVMDDPTTAANDPRVMNLPCDLLPDKEHGKERLVGNSLAVFAHRKTENCDPAAVGTEFTWHGCWPQSRGCCRPARSSRCCCGRCM